MAGVKGMKTGGRSTGRKSRYPSEDVIIKEMVIPCIATMMRSPLNVDGGGFLNFYLSKTELRLVYGPKGEAVFCTFFKEVRKGFRQGTNARQTIWTAKPGVFNTFKQLYKDHGLDIKSPPLSESPPPAMVLRLRALQKKLQVTQEELDEVLKIVDPVTI